MSVRNRTRLAHAIAGSRSIRGALKKLRLAPAGGNYETIKKAIREFGLDTSHFTGQGHLRGSTHGYSTRPLRDILVRGRLEHTARLKRRLLAKGIKRRRCECCGLTEWLWGDRSNNLLRNLELLCPNCHALTDNYRGKNKKV